MMTREEILSIEEYCIEHKVSHKKRLEELEIPFWHFYKAKRKYRKDDEQGSQSGEFIQLSSGKHVPQTISPARTSRRSGKARKPVTRKDLPVEETHIYPDGINFEEYTEIGVEITDKIAIRPAVMYIGCTVRHKFVFKSSLQVKEPEKNKPSSSLQCRR